MSTATIVHRVTYFGPGTFSSEQVEHKLDEWNVSLALAEAISLTDTKPYAFQFSTWTEHPDISDGAGGWLKVTQRCDLRSGMHFLPGTVLTMEGVAASNTGKDDILLSNMQGNWPIVVEVVNGWRNTIPFGEKDVMINSLGQVVERGDTPERIAYRAKVLGR